jgi:REP element-mobilizing transposase RayT
MSQIPTQLKQENLAEIVADSSVFAAVLLKSGEVQTQTRTLDPTGLKTIQNALARYWLGTARTDLNRYAGLEIDGHYYFLFAEKINKANDLIALIFPLEIPLIRIRREMTSLVKKILNFKAPPTSERHQSFPSNEQTPAKKAKTPQPPSHQEEKDEEEDPLEQTLQFLFKSFPEPDPDDNEPSPDPENENSWQPESFRNSSEEKKEKTVPEESSPLPKNEAPASDPIPQHQKPQNPNPNNSEEGFQELPLGTDLITPKSKNPDKPILPVKKNTKEDVDHIPLTPIPPDDDLFSSDETGPIRVTLPDEDENDWQPLNELPVQDEDLASILQDDFDLDKDPNQGPAADGFTTLDDDVFDTEELEEETTEPEDEQEGDEDTLLAEILAGEKEDAQSMDSVSDVTFYLVPRLAHHYILGELAHRLRRWVPKICQAFGWRLDTLSVRPDYLKWTFNDFPEAATKDMLQIMRRQTSDRIFRDFPSLQVENQTGDYWSPSYLVDKENRYFSTQALMSFVSKTRFEDEDSL